MKEKLRILERLGLTFLVWGMLGLAACSGAVPTKTVQSLNETQVIRIETVQMQLLDRDTLYPSDFVEVDVDIGPSGQRVRVTLPNAPPSVCTPPIGESELLGSICGTLDTMAHQLGVSSEVGSEIERFAGHVYVSTLSSMAELCPSSVGVTGACTVMAEQDGGDYFVFFFSPGSTSQTAWHEYFGHALVNLAPAHEQGGVCYTSTSGNIERFQATGSGTTAMTQVSADVWASTAEWMGLPASSWGEGSTTSYEPSYFNPAANTHLDEQLAWEGRAFTEWRDLMNEMVGMLVKSGNVGSVVNSVALGDYDGAWETWAGAIGGHFQNQSISSGPEVWFEMTNTSDAYTNAMIQGINPVPLGEQELSGGVAQYCP